MELTLAQLKAMAPYASDANLNKYLPALNAVFFSYDIDCPIRIAHFMAQVIHESGSFVYTVEIASGNDYEYRADLGNTQKGDGPRFKGRGLIQLTGRANYKKYGDHLFVDLVSKPEMVATNYAADVAGWFWSTHDLNALADCDNLTTITKVINGGLNGYDDRLHNLGLAKRALGI